MASSPEIQIFRYPSSTSEFFHDTVQRLLHDNVDYVLSASLGSRRNVEVLHLIDPQPQGSVPLDYHLVYESFDVESQVTTHGIYLANPRVRSRRAPPHESRHYFDGGKSLIVREDKVLHGREYEFLRGSRLYPEDALGDPDCMDMLQAFHDNLNRIKHSTPVKPVSLVFNQFARLK